MADKKAKKGSMSDQKLLKIKEQIIWNDSCGLTIQFQVTPDGKEFRVKLFGDILKYGNRDFQFNSEGELIGTGTAMQYPKCFIKP